MAAKSSARVAWPKTAHRRLDAFVGIWHADGASYAEGQQAHEPRASAVRWTSEESYEWLPGKFFLLHRWDAMAGERSFMGTEILGYDEEHGGYFAHFFDNAGFHPEYQLAVDGAVWTFSEPQTRATVMIDDGRKTMTCNWEWRNGGTQWLPLCDRIATRTG